MHTKFLKRLLRLQNTRMRLLLLRRELTYSDIAKGWFREVWQDDSRFIEVGGLIGKRDRIVRIGGVARNITSKRNLSVSCLF